MIGDPGFGLRENLFVVVKPEGFHSEAVVRPDEPFDFGLLNHHIFFGHFRQKEDNLFGDLSFWVVFADGAEAVFEMDAESGFLLRFLISRYSTLPL